MAIEAFSPPNRYENRGRNVIFLLYARKILFAFLEKTLTFTHPFSGNNDLEIISSRF
jgi:hypothetical protein